MKAVLCLVAAFAAASLSQDTKSDDQRGQIFQRLIPADTLRGKHNILNNQMIEIIILCITWCSWCIFDVDRFPWNLLCIHKMCNFWTRCAMGFETVLWTFHLCGTTRTFVGVGRRLWPIAKTKLKMQALWQDEQNCWLPRLLPPLWVRTWRQVGISRSSTTRRWTWI